MDNSNITDINKDDLDLAISNAMMRKSRYVVQVYLYNSKGDCVKSVYVPSDDRHQGTVWWKNKSIKDDYTRKI